MKYDEAFEEAICFGWVDSKPNNRDNESYYLFCAQRNPRSNWSKANRERVEALMREGRMSEAGLNMVAQAKETGTRTALVDVQNGVIPDDLQALYDQGKLAFDNFQKFPPSSRRIILEWILNAKRPATREKRIRETVDLAASSIRANHYRQ